MSDTLSAIRTPVPSPDTFVTAKGAPAEYVILSSAMYGR